MELPPRSGPPKTLTALPGAQAEAAAQHFLEAQGFRLVQANYRCRRGEIDLVMQRDRLLVFAEVRLRNRQDFGGAAASVTPAKQQKVIACAEAFLHHHPGFSHCNCRFDVLALQSAKPSAPEKWQIEWLQAAFTP